MPGGPAPTINPGSALGVNFNGVLSNLALGDLIRAKTRWIRGFVDYFQFRNGLQHLHTDPGLQQLRLAHNAGYKTVINHKFDFSTMRFPTTQNDREALLNYVDTLLTVVYPDCDILVIGNEPFIESLRDDRGPELVAFYVAAAEKVRAFHAAQARQIPLYLGTYDSIWKPSWQIQAAIDLMAYTEATPWLQGADLHIHQEADTDIDGAFAFTSPRLRADQKILVTEFSQVNYYLQFNDYPIPRELVLKYGRDASWKVYDYLNFALHHPVTIEEWTAFLENSPWFNNQIGYLPYAWYRFNAWEKFGIAAYAMYQSGPTTFTAGDQPWILNPIFVNQTVVPDVAGDYQYNYVYGEQFRALQVGTVPIP